MLKSKRRRFSFPLKYPQFGDNSVGRELSVCSFTKADRASWEHLILCYVITSYIMNWFLLRLVFLVTAIEIKIDFLYKFKYNVFNWQAILRIVVLSIFTGASVCLRILGSCERCTIKATYPIKLLPYGLYSSSWSLSMTTSFFLKHSGLTSDLKHV
jgi:hypothetical protein